MEAESEEGGGGMEGGRKRGMKGEREGGREGGGSIHH